MNWLYLGIAIVSEVIATSALKASNGFSVISFVLLAMLGYLFSFYFLSVTLKSIPVGIAYAIWSGVGLTLITLVGYVIYDQKLDLAAFIGIVLILSGVMVVGFFSKSVMH